MPVGLDRAPTLAYGPDAPTLRCHRLEEHPLSYVRPRAARGSVVLIAVALLAGACSQEAETKSSQGASGNAASNTKDVCAATKKLMIDGMKEYAAVIGA